MQKLQFGVPKAPYHDVYMDTFIFFLWSLYKIIWMNIHYFPNAPSMRSSWTNERAADYVGKCIWPNPSLCWENRRFSCISALRRIYTSQNF